MNRRDRMARLQDIAHVADTLRAAPVDAPDFTSSILDRVDAERPFLAPSVRRKLPWVRLGLGACVALSVLAVALTHRWAPSAVQLADQPAPISDVVQCVECAACKQLVSLRPAAMRITEQECSRFLVAMAAAASISENEARPSIGADAPVTMTAILPLSQAVPLDTPAPPAFAAASVNRAPLGVRSLIAPSRSSLAEFSPRLAMSSAEIPRVKVFPTFLEHDLDGLIFPR
jgi:hypothetical protein